MPRPDRGERPAGLRRISFPQAAALGLLQGAAEPLPVSSSGHATLLPWLAGWSHAELDADLRKSFEVAVHGGSALALLASINHRPAGVPRHMGLLLGSLIPPALAGLLLGEHIERRLGTPASVAGGLIGGALAMAAADRLGGRRRGRADVRPRDGVALGLAQAAALVPGVSRNGATLAMARARGFERSAAHALSREAALPVLVSATVWQGRRAWSRRPSGREAAWLATGGLSAFASTLVIRRLLRASDGDHPLAPFVAYRLALAAVAIRRLRDNGGVHASLSPARGPGR